MFDEAHSLSAKVVEHFATRHALRGAREWVRTATDSVPDAVLALRLDEGLLRDARDQARCIDQAPGEPYRLIQATRAFEERKARRFPSAGGPLMLCPLDFELVIEPARRRATGGPRG